MTSKRQALTEFSLIERFFKRAGQSANSHQCDVGIGDDCALITLPEQRRLAISVDTLVAGRHFPVDAGAADIGYRSLAVSASDLAAVGAKPLAATLALTLPEIDAEWLQLFSDGFYRALQDFGMTLVGGDTTQGPLAITVQVHGCVPVDRALLRNGASVGDRIFVSGTLGDARAALSAFAHPELFDSAQTTYLRQRFYQPQPRFSLGESLLDIASSAIDVSDGLVADLGHIVARSGVGARIHLDQLPLSAVLSDYSGRQEALRWAATGGDDYELCFTVKPEHRDKLEAIAGACQLPLTEIGEIVTGAGLTAVNAGGDIVEFTTGGYQHFAE